MVIGHHRIPRSQGGSWSPENIMPVDQRLERNMHNHESTRLFHQKILHIIDHWDTTNIIPEVRERIRDVIVEVGPEMYEPKAVLSWRHISDSFQKRGGIYIPKDYEQ